MFALYQLLINERFHLHTVTSGSFPAYSIVRKQKHGRRNPVMFLFLCRKLFMSRLLKSMTIFHTNQIKERIKVRIWQVTYVQSEPIISV